MRAVLALADSPDALGMVVNVGATEEVTILELARAVLEEVGGLDGQADDRVVTVPYDEAFPVGFEDMRRRVPDISSSQGRSSAGNRRSRCARRSGG